MEEQGVIRRFVADERGATAIEYAVIAGLMFLVVVSIAATGGALDSVFERVSLIIDAIGGGG
ncbi:MAG TPA: Flp family type IVb pilin [Propylenella sp.]|nr:Flp family type IVb pilin [Propylenella sp.]